MSADWVCIKGIFPWQNLPSPRNEVPFSFLKERLLDVRQILIWKDDKTEIDFQAKCPLAREI